MKASEYNVFTKWKDFYCGVNLISGCKIVLLKADYDCFISTPKQLNTKLYTSLIQGGFLIGNDEDEYTKILHTRNKAVFYNNNTFQLTILPTLECNFRCWYCYEQHSTSKMTSATLRKIFKYIDYIVDQYPIFKFHLDWFGGEPLFYFDEVVEPISLYVKEVCEKQHISFQNTMTTNAFLMNDTMISKFRSLDLNGFQITLDGYKDLHNKTRFEKRGDDSYSKIIENINNICRIVDSPSINIRINYTNKIFYIWDVLQTIYTLKTATEHTLHYSEFGKHETSKMIKKSKPDLKNKSNIYAIMVLKSTIIEPYFVKV